MMPPRLLSLRRSFSIPLLALLIGLGSFTLLHSQQPVAPQAIPAANPVDPATLQSLQALKAANAALIQRQETLMKRLKVLEEEARQLRIFAKRS